MVLPPELPDRVQWLSTRLDRRELSGYQVGGIWRMTEDDVALLIEKHRKPAKPPKVTRPIQAPREPAEVDQSGAGANNMHSWKSTAEKLGGISRAGVFRLWAEGDLGSVTIGSRRFSTDGQIAKFIQGLPGAE